MSFARESTSSLFDSCVREIEDAYQALGHTLGWRFLSVSKAVLDRPVKIAVITINPAGKSIPPNHPRASCEDGSSYLVERWGEAPAGRSTLQIQVQSMFWLLKNSTGFVGEVRDLVEQSLISHFIPFRSPRLAELPRKGESLAFGRKLWATLLPVSLPRLIICLGRDVQRELQNLIPSAMSANHTRLVSYSTGWGEYTAEIDTYSTKDGTVRLLFLPHLSTWTLFTSVTSASNMPGIIQAAALGL
jgi:hypothetical protein